MPRSRDHLHQPAPTWTVGADVAAAPPVGHPHPLHDGRLHRRVGAAPQAGQLTPARATLDQSEVSIVSRDSSPPTTAHLGAAAVPGARHGQPAVDDGAAHEVRGAGDEAGGAALGPQLRAAQPPHAGQGQGVGGVEPQPREVVPPHLAPHLGRDQLGARVCSSTLVTSLELETKVHTKFRNHGEFPY